VDTNKKGWLPINVADYFFFPKNITYLHL